MELVVLSGKGGTGKTTIVAALSELNKNIVKIDCDVDAPNLYLLYKGIDREKNDFYGGKKARLNQSLCNHCGSCEEVCRFGALKNAKIDPLSCEGCGACTLVCPQHAISLVEEKTAETFITETEKGLLSRATMNIGSDGSGKLVTHLRKNARNYTGNNTLTLIDGSPGIGCSVIASVTGADVALIVTEPTKSGLEDLKRILELVQHFETSVMVCINKYDINLEITEEIMAYAEQKKIFFAGKIPFDKRVMESINSLKPITEYQDSMARKAIEEMWVRMSGKIDKKKNGGLYYDDSNSK